MANTYSPAAGTVAARVVAWLQARPSGEYNAAQIAEALNVDPKAIAPSLEVALRERLVFHRQRDRTSPRAPWWYSARDREEHQRRNGFAAAATWMPAPKKDTPDTPQGDQPRSDRGREVMEPEACESAAGRGTTGAPALATLPHTASPGVGPMGAGQPADAGPTTDMLGRPMRFDSSGAYGAIAIDARAPGSAAGAAGSTASVTFTDRDINRNGYPGAVDGKLPPPENVPDGWRDQLHPADLAATRRAARYVEHGGKRYCDECGQREGSPHLSGCSRAFRAARFSDGSLATERDGMVVAVYSAAEVDAIQKLLGART